MYIQSKSSVKEKQRVKSHKENRVHACNDSNGCTSNYTTVSQVCQPGSRKSLLKCYPWEFGAYVKPNWESSNFHVHFSINLYYYV